jgi:hypothetical protein
MVRYSKRASLREFDALCAGHRMLEEGQQRSPVPHRKGVFGGRFLRTSLRGATKQSDCCDKNVIVPCS